MLLLLVFGSQILKEDDKPLQIADLFGWLIFEPDEPFQNLMSLHYHSSLTHHKSGNLPHKDQTIFQKVGEIKKDSNIEAEEKVRLIFFFYAIFLEKNKGFARILSREALGPSEQNVIDSVNQFYERLELSIKQLLASKKDSLQLTAGQSAHLITSIMEGIISRFNRNKFKEIPSSYIENYWSLISSSIFKA